MRSGKRMKQGVWPALVAAAALCGAGAAGAARIDIDPALKSLSCVTPACDSVGVTVTLLLTELGADGFEFQIAVSNASLIGYTSGPVSAGSLADGSWSGGVVYNAGVFSGSIVTNPDSFDGPQTFTVAIIDLVASGTGTSNLTHLSSEISCSTCNGGGGQIFGSQNTSGELIGVINVTPIPEPGSAALLAAALAALAAGRMRR